MRLTLSPEQTQSWLAGGYSAWRLEEDYLEMAKAQAITEAVVVVLADETTVAFAFTLDGGEL